MLFITRVWSLLPGYDTLSYPSISLGPGYALPFQGMLFCCQGIVLSYPGMILSLLPGYYTLFVTRV